MTSIQFLAVDIFSVLAIKTSDHKKKKDTSFIFLIHSSFNVFSVNACRL